MGNISAHVHQRLYCMVCYHVISQCRCVASSNIKIKYDICKACASKHVLIAKQRYDATIKDIQYTIRPFVWELQGQNDWVLHTAFDFYVIHETGEMFNVFTGYKNSSFRHIIGGYHGTFKEAKSYVETLLLVKIKQGLLEVE